MTCSEPPSLAKRALLIEPQTLFAPYLVATLEATGLEVVGVEPIARARRLYELHPDVVMIDAGHAHRGPLRMLRALRRRLPKARIVIYVHEHDPTWTLVARTLGADAVIGPRADEADLVAALASPVGV